MLQRYFYNNNMCLSSPAKIFLPNGDYDRDLRIQNRNLTDVYV